MASNPGLSCKRLFKSQQICLLMVTASTTSSAPQCGQSVFVVVGDTCASVAVKYSVESATFASLNPGVNCNINLAVGSYVCVAPTAPSTTINCTGWYRVMQGDTCPSIWNGANLTMSMFLSINPGIQCQAPYLVVGQRVCIDAPLLTTMQRNPNANYSIYTVRAGDTLSNISSLYLPRCTALSVSPAAIAAQNFIADLSAPLAVNTSLIIPCIGGIGMIDAGCAVSLPKCGSDFVIYPSYCDAAANYALPVYDDVSRCYDPCSLACVNRMGLKPLNTTGCTQAICPYPSWFRGDECYLGYGINIDAPCCSYRNSFCATQCSLTVETLGGTSTTRTKNYANCMGNCICCAVYPCGGSWTCNAPNNTCYTASPRTCTYSIGVGYMFTCSYFPAVVPTP